MMSPSSTGPPCVLTVTPDPRSFAQRRADALALICESFLARGPADDDDRYQIIIHATADMLTAGPDGHATPDTLTGSTNGRAPDHARRGELDNGVPLSARPRQRLGRRP